VAHQKLSVRQTEALVKATRDGGDPTKGPKQKDPKSPGVRDLEGRLARRYGTKCEVRDRQGKGEIVIPYSDLDELDRILEQLFA
jgi:ParB family transcriptional regulator, chromosome partitioning protein